MVVRRGGIAHEALEFGACEIARHDFALGERTERSGVADHAAQLHGRYRGLEVIGVRQHVCLDLYRVCRIGASQTDMAAALRPHHAAAQCPDTLRHIESGRGLCAGQWKFNLAGLQIWGV